MYVGMMTATSRDNFFKSYAKEYKIVKNVDDCPEEDIYNDISELSQYC